MSVQGATTGPATADPAAAFNTMEIFMSGLEKSLGKSLAPLEKVSKQMGSSSFGKNAKALGSAMKGMAGASVQAWAMEQLMKLIEPFMKLLELLAIPIDILSALLTIMVNEIFVQLLPYILAFSMMLLDLMPVFKKLGEILGWLIENIIKTLVDWVKQFIVWIVPLLKILWDRFLPIWEKIRNFFAPFVAWLGRTFLPLWEGIKTLFAGLKEAWDKSGGQLFGKDGFIAKAFKVLLDFGKTIVNWFIGGINKVIGIINEIPGVDISRIPQLAQGGITTGTGLAVLHPNEAVIPLDRAGEFGFGKDPQMLAEMEENNRLMRILIKQNRERDAWRL